MPPPFEADAAALAFLDQRGAVVRDALDTLIAAVADLWPLDADGEAGAIADTRAHLERLLAPFPPAQQHDDLLSLLAAALVRLARPVGEEASAVRNRR